jgi:hypothetical protein
MVYEHGLRVKGVDEAAYARDLRPPADETIAHGFERAGEAVTGNRERPRVP